MTKDEWIAFYNEKNPQDPFERDERYMLLFQEDKGFCEVLFTPDLVSIGQICGDGPYWKNHVDEAAQKLGIHKGLTFDIRGKIRGYMRLFDYKPYKKELVDDGLFRYYAKGIHSGKAFTASPAWKYDDYGIVAYRVIWEI